MTLPGPHGEEADRAVSNHEAQVSLAADSSRRARKCAPQDEAFAPRPLIMISTAAVSSTPMHA